MIYNFSRQRGILNEERGIDTVPGMTAAPEDPPWATLQVVEWTDAERKPFAVHPHMNLSGDWGVTHVAETRKSVGSVKSLEECEYLERMDRYDLADLDCGGERGLARGVRVRGRADRDRVCADRDRVCADRPQVGYRGHRL